MNSRYSPICKEVLQSVLHQQPRDLVFLKYCVRMPGIGGRADTYEIGVRVRATTHTDARPHGSFKCPRVATFMLLRSLRDPWPNPDLWTRSAANPDYGHQIRRLGPAHRSAFSLLQINLGWDPPSHGHARLLAINPLRRARCDAFEGRTTQIFSDHTCPLGYGGREQSIQIMK